MAENLAPVPKTQELAPSIDTPSTALFIHIFAPQIRTRFIITFDISETVKVNKNTSRKLL